jgi:class 3 adenylate cyclase
MIFIALAVAWSLSDASRLKRVGLAPRIKLIAMTFDLRRSTQWFRRMGIENSDYIGTFMDELLELALNYTSVLPYGRPNLIKFLGDGYMFIWEVPDDSTSITRLRAVVGAACALHDNYRSWIKDPTRAWMDPPNSIGVGVDLGCASRYTFENGSIDYKGSPVDNVAKMQDLARPDGGVVIQANWQLSDELRDKFPVEGQMVIGNECIAVRATGGVKLQARNKIKLVR